MLDWIKNPVSAKEYARQRKAQGCKAPTDMWFPSGKFCKSVSCVNGKRSAEGGAGVHHEIGCLLVGRRQLWLQCKACLAPEGCRQHCCLIALPCIACAGGSQTSGVNPRALRSPRTTPQATGPTSPAPAPAWPSSLTTSPVRAAASRAAWCSSHAAAARCCPAHSAAATCAWGVDRMGHGSLEPLGSTGAAPGCQGVGSQSAGLAAPPFRRPCRLLH